MVHDRPGAELVGVEIHFIHSLILRVLGHTVEADRVIVNAEEVLQQVTHELPLADRQAMYANLSPYREIMAGAARVRAEVEHSAERLGETVEL